MSFHKQAMGVHLRERHRNVRVFGNYWLRAICCSAALSIVAAALGVLAIFAPIAARPSPPDIIFIGHFLTLDASHPEADALAVTKGRIVAVGSLQDIERLATQATPRIQFAGFAAPGLADAHVHVTGVGGQLERLNLRGLSKADTLKLVADAVHSASPGQWIFGGGWDEGFWQPSVFPTAQELDTVSGDHPVILSRIDGHSTWVNSRVLQLAKISHSTPDPDGGLIRRNSQGEPTGMLVDNAQQLIRHITPKPTDAEKERRIRAALRQYSAWGLTTVDDAGVDLQTIDIYKHLLKRGELSVRIYAMATGEAAISHYLAGGPEVDLGDGMLSVRSFKLFLDGALGSRGAELTEPYSDAPSERGLQLMNDADLDRIVKTARQKGFQVNTHAIGDRAVKRALDAFERAGVTRDERFRVEHASMVTDQDLSRFVRFGTIASIQPVFVGEYSRWTDERVGPSRIHWVLRTHDFLDAGVALAAGTDYPASDSGNPIDTLYCLVTRQSSAGKPDGGWYSDQRVGIDEALRMMSAGPAYATFQEKNLGALTVGRYADFTVVSANPYKVRSSDLRSLTVRLTVVGGRVTFDANKTPVAPGPDSEKPE